MPRKNRYYGNRRPLNYKPGLKRYEAEKAAWIAHHKQSSGEEYIKAMREIAARCGI